MHVDEVALRVEVQVPHPLEQHGARDDLAGAPHEEFEQLQLPRRQLDLPAAAGHAPRQQIEVEVSHLERRGIRRARVPAAERLDARQQLRERERLRQIVVAARL